MSAEAGANSRGKVFVCQGTGCMSSKSDQIRAALESEVARLGLADRYEVKFSGCHGFCQQGPIVIVEPEGIFYSHVKVDDAPEIAQSHLRDEKPVARLFYHDPVTGEAVPRYQDISFYAKQQRIVLRNCGHINPEDIDDYLEVGGYQALKKVLQEMTPEQVIDEVKRSGIRGRGGAGFSTGLKWEFCRKSPGTEKYIICNADEGDPGAFMDRSTMEGDPHTVIEGMLIGAYAIGAPHGYIYCRAEYPLAIRRLRIAIDQASERGFLGNNILSSDFSLDIIIKEGAGAFVCGEETALMASIEGKRGMPRPRPPFPAQSGVWGKPTNINNVETWANIPVIITRGADWYASIGTEKSKGTKVFALTGKIANSGLVEVPMGIPLREIIYDIGGGIPEGKRFKAAQTGGPSGGCLPTSLLDIPVDFESLTQAGSIMGSGGMVVMDEDSCMVDLARYFLSFTQAESCGKCVPCRVGTKQMLDVLNRLTQGEGQEGDIEKLLALSETVMAGSLCALGGTAPNPVLTTIRYFRDEYEAHIKKRCPAVVCKKIIIAPCRHACPAGIDVPRYIRLIGQGKPAESLAVIREKIPFPSVCGHVCFHPCETKCRRGQLDEPIAIRALKRFAAERDNGLWKQAAKVAPATGKRVAIVGSGPAGMTAAYYLAKLGHSVTVFEELPQLGGMMRVGIPDYRLPQEVLDEEIEVIKSVGVETKTNSRIDSVDELFQQGYNAVFLGIGAHEGMKLGIEGEEDEGVMDCVSFLRDVKLGKEIRVGGRVMVIGGGNAAIDASRTALRLGAKEVVIVYRRTRAEMPASEEEIEEALREGVDFRYLAAPTKLSRENGVLKIECIQMMLGPVDASGRPRPEPLPGSEFTLDTDTVIAAIGQMPDVPAQFELPQGRGGTLEVDPDTLATPREGVFAGGDAVTGPASVIEAIAAGRQAAISIDKYLGGSGAIEESLAPNEEVASVREEEEEEVHRPSIPAIPVADRIGSFAEVELGLTEEQALAETKRCLWCDLEEE
jgi:NADH-quinone oxidoreductase subunit F